MQNSRTLEQPLLREKKPKQRDRRVEKYANNSGLLVPWSAHKLLGPKIVHTALCRQSVIVCFPRAFFEDISTNTHIGLVITWIDIAAKNSFILNNFHSWFSFERIQELIVSSLVGSFHVHLYYILFKFPSPPTVYLEIVSPSVFRQKKPE